MNDSKIQRMSYQTLDNEYNNKIITPEEAEHLRAEGWKRADLHSHTTASHDVPNSLELRPAAIYAKARKLGLDFYSATDHDTIEAYMNLPERPDIVRGVELTVSPSRHNPHVMHVNVYDFSDEQFQKLNGDGYEQGLKQQGIIPVIEYLSKENIPFLFNHPYWFTPEDEEKIRKNPEMRQNIKKSIETVAPFFPIIEYNTKRPRELNELALQLAQKYGKGMMCNTDTHTGHIGEAYTLAPGETFREYFNNIAAGEYRLVVRDIDANSFNQELNDWVRHFIASAKGSAIMETGHSIANTAQRLLVRETWGGTFARSALEKLVRGFANTGIPARHYINRQRELAYLFAETR